MKQVRAKKHLGQHFLNDLSIAQRITDSLQSQLPVLEVGPGMGVLTRFLVQKPGIDLKLVEIDTESVDYLKQHFPELESRIIYGDFLKLDLPEIMANPLRSSAISLQHFEPDIFKVLDHIDLVPEVVGMLQKEVAERLAAKPGCKEYGILSVLLQAYYDIEYLFTVDAQVFTPPPKVQSAVIRITRNQTHNLGCDTKLFKQVIKATFNQRRKAIRNSLKLLSFNREAVMDSPLVNLRPEQLSVAQFVELTLLVQNNPALQ